MTEKWSFLSIQFKIITKMIHIRGSWTILDTYIHTQKYQSFDESGYSNIFEWILPVPSNQANMLQLFITITVSMRLSCLFLKFCVEFTNFGFLLFINQSNKIVRQFNKKIYSMFSNINWWIWCCWKKATTFI